MNVSYLYLATKSAAMILIAQRINIVLKENVSVIPQRNANLIKNAKEMVQHLGAVMENVLKLIHLLILFKVASLMISV